MWTLCRAVHHTTWSPLQRRAEDFRFRFYKRYMKPTSGSLNGSTKLNIFMRFYQWCNFHFVFFCFPPLQCLGSVYTLDPQHFGFLDPVQRTKYQLKTTKKCAEKREMSLFLNDFSRFCIKISNKRKKKNSKFHLLKKSVNLK